MTPLHWATQNGHKEVVDYLINKEANLTIANKFDLTALDIAKQISHVHSTLESSFYSVDIATQNLVIQLAHNETQNVEIQEDQVLAAEDVGLVDNGDQTPIIIPLGRESCILIFYFIGNISSCGHKERDINGQFPINKIGNNNSCDFIVIVFTCFFFLWCI